MYREIYMYIFTYTYRNIHIKHEKKHMYTHVYTMLLALLQGALGCIPCVFANHSLIWKCYGCYNINIKFIKTMKRGKTDV